MDKRIDDQSLLEMDRRGLLKAAGVAGALAAGGVLASASAGAQDASYVLEQVGDCVPLQPLSGDQPVETFYDYKEHDTRYSAVGMERLQRESTSLLFLYRGPKGLSLVMEHDKRQKEDTPDGGGGSVSFDITGLPTDGSWVVTDDMYDGPRNVDRWNLDGSEAKIDWTWVGGRTDGGAYRGLGSDADIVIRPAFNEQAALYGKFYPGDVKHWQALSGDVSDPDRTELQMDEPVTIHAGSCG